MKTEKKIKNIFSSIANRYDRANSVLTFGMDSLWRKKVVVLSQVSKKSSVLDCATGTGRLAFEFLNHLGEQGRVVGIDFCEEMLKQIKKQDSRMTFQKADILNLPFSNRTFDVTSIAYGLRNLSDQEKGIKEMARVTRKFVMILETGVPTNVFLRPLIRLYTSLIVPLLGGLVTGNFSAYRYLNRSSKNFPSGQKMISLLKQTNCFKSVECFPLLGGASFIYKAQVHS